MQLYLLRHAEPERSEPIVSYGHNWPLTPTGRNQAEIVRMQIGMRGPFDLVVSSPLRRAFETAEVVAAGNDDIMTASFLFPIEGPRELVDGMLELAKELYYSNEPPLRDALEHPRGYCLMGLGHYMAAQLLDLIARKNLSSAARILCTGHASLISVLARVLLSGDGANFVERTPLGLASGFYLETRDLITFRLAATISPDA